MIPPHFCDYLPFEEDLALYLNNLEFPLSKDLKKLESSPLNNDLLQV
jgi:hypothetical protein